MNIHKRKKMSKLPIIIFLVIFGFFGAFKVISYIDRVAAPIFLNYAEMQTKRILTIVINKSLTDEIMNNNDFDNLLIVKTNDKSDVQTIDFNNASVNKFLREYTENIFTNIRDIEKGRLDSLEFEFNELTLEEIDNLKRGIVFNMPMGLATNTYLLMNVGPKIPVRFHLVGTAQANILTEVKEYGINNALISTFVEVTVTGRITLAILAKEVVITTKRPLATKVIQGNIPNYYLNGFGSRSNISNGE